MDTVKKVINTWFMDTVKKGNKHMVHGHSEKKVINTWFMDTVKNVKKTHRS